MTPKNYIEMDFEDHIEEQLLKRGYQSFSFKDYDKTLCLIPTQLLEFIRTTQKRTFQKLELQYD